MQGLQLNIGLYKSWISWIVRLKTEYRYWSSKQKGKAEEISQNVCRKGVRSEGVSVVIMIMMIIMILNTLGS